jgi:hypothetical protein
MTNSPVDSITLNPGLCDSLTEHVDKACALVVVATTCDHFTECHTAVMHDYLWTLMDILNKVKTISKELCNQALIDKGNSREQDKKS